MEFSLKEFSENCQSSKRPIRKKSVQLLSDILDNPLAIQLLNRSCSADTLNWNTVFLSVHSGLLLESVCWKADEDKDNSSATVISNRETYKTQFSSLADIIIKKANASKLNIKCDNILTASFRIFSDRYLRKNFAFVYLNILLDSVLPVRRYRTSLSVDQWNELFDHLLVFLKADDSKDWVVHSALALMNLVIRYGCEQSQLGLQVKNKLLPMLESKFIVLHSKAILQETLLSLIVNACDHVAKESRTAVCHLGELILQPIINMYDSRNDDSSSLNKMVVDFLLLQVHCHHPTGEKEGSEAAYACDWKKWNIHMRSMYRAVLSAILKRQKAKDHQPFSDSFLDLCVELCNQLFDKAKSAHEFSVTMNETVYTDEGPAPKRRKWMIGTEELFEELQASKKDASCWPLIALVLNILQKYPVLFQDVELGQLQEILSEMQCNCRNRQALTYVCRCFEQLITEMVKRNLKSDSWLTVWETTLRSVGLNQNESHPLLQTLIIEKMAPLSGLESLLQMYQSSRIQLTNESLLTFMIFVSHYHLPESSSSAKSGSQFTPWESSVSSARVLLLDWLCSASQDASVDLQLLANVLVALIVKLRHKPQISQFSGCTNSIKLRETSLESDYCVSAFEKGLLLPLNFMPAGNVAESTDVSSSFVDSVSQSKLESLLAMKCEKLDQRAAEFKERDVLTQARNAATVSKLRAELTCDAAKYAFLTVNILSLMINYGVISNESMHNYCLNNNLARAMDILKTLLPISLETKEDDPERGPVEDVPRTIQILDCLGNLYGSNLLPTVRSHLCDITGQEIIIPVVTLFSTAPKICQSLDTALLKKLQESRLPFVNDDSRLTDIDFIHFCCLKILTGYGCPKQGKVLHNKQKSVINRILKVFSDDDIYDLSLESTFMLVCQAMSSILACELLDQDKHLKPIITLLQSICRKWKQDAEASSYIMSLLKDIFKHASMEDRKWEKAASFILLAPFRNKKFGPKFTIQLISCFEELQKVDPGSKWARWSNALDFRHAVDSDTIPKEALKKFEDDEGNVAMIEEVVLFLLNPFHEVRLAAVPVVSSIFCGQYSLLWMQTMFERLTVVLYDLFIVKGIDMSEAETIDEGVNRTATVLHVLSAIIVSSTTQYQQALLLSFRLFKEKSLKLDLLKKVFDLFAIPMKIDNTQKFLQKSLAAVLHQWLLWGYPLQEFPYHLLNMQSFPDFVNRFKGIILPVILKSKDQEDLLKIICKEARCTPSEIFEVSFPSVYAQHLAFLVNNSENACAPLAKLERKNFEVFETAVGKVKIKQLLSSKLDDILTEICKLVWDPCHHEELLGLTSLTVQASVTSICRDSYSTAMKYLERALGLESDLLVYIGLEKPIIMQRVLLQLRGDMSSAVNLDQKIKAFHSYSVFAHAVAFRLEKGDFPNIADFLLSDITHSLLYEISENESNAVMIDVCIGSCCFLNVLCTHLLPACAPALTTLLPTIVGSLIPLALGNTVLAEKSMELLKLLVISNSTCLGDAIGNLPPFPESPVFEAMQKVHSKLKYHGNVFSLEDEIKHFLSSTISTTSLASQNSMFDALHFLRKQLSEKKAELSLLYKDLEFLRGFAKDCRESLLHQLICRLIGLTSCADTKVQLEASRCLGELGPADLTTLVLRPAEGCINLVKGYSAPMMCVMALAAHYLTEYLLDHDICVVRTASSALLSLMACKDAGGLCSTNGGSNCIETKKVTPFLPKKATKPNPSIIPDTLKVISVLCGDEIWCPGEKMLHNEWITRLACSFLTGLSNDDLFGELASVCKVKTSFAEEILPVLFYLALSHSADVCHKLCACLSKFFEEHYSCVYSEKNSQTPRLSAEYSNIYLNRASVECMLNIVNFVRLQKSSVRDKSFSLELNYLHVASAAQFCSAYSSSIMYLELWCNGANRSIQFDNSSMAYVDYISEIKPDDGKSLQNLLTKAYEQIGDNDALYGCGSTMLLNPKTRVNQYEYIGMWDKVLLNYDVKLSHDSDVDTANGLVNALHRSGLLHLLNIFIGSLPSDQKQHLFSSQLECMWRLGQWSTPLTSSSKIGGFEWNQYSALQATRDGNKSSVYEYVTEGRLSILKGLAHASLENCKNIYKPLFQLQALQEIEEFVTSDDIFDTINSWNNQNALPHHDLLLLEPILAQRAKLLEIKLFQKETCNRSAEITSPLLQALTQLYLNTAELARQEEQPQIAEQWLHSLSVMPNISAENKRHLCLEEAQLAWSCSKGLSDRTNSVARQLLNSLLKELQVTERESGVRSKLLPQVLITYGRWMAEAHSENPQVIIEDYLEEALHLLEEIDSVDSVKEQIEAHCCLAHFADLEYQRITTYIKSESFQSKVECMEALREKANQAKLCKAKDKESLKEQQTAVTISLKYSEMDEGEINSTNKDRDKYMELAMRHYLISMKLGEGANVPVFRMVSLWLENATHDAVNNQVISSLDSIQTYKFVVLLPQLAARIGDNMKDVFTRAIYQLLLRCALEHPHHTLPLLLALANSYEDFAGKVKPDPEPRVLGATRLISELRRNKLVSATVSEMDKLAKALISLAYVPVPDSSPSVRDVPKEEKIRQMRNLNHAMLPIISLPVQSDAKYPTIIGIHSFETKYAIAGGVNRPKRIKCTGSDGIKRPLLVKGKDDLRQDAVMQQVFTIMNTLLQACEETKRRRLLIRTYKIVPLSQRCGVLQWCENTSPLQEILIDIHGRYFPGDWKAGACMKKTEAARAKSIGERLHVYKEICKNFHPAFRFFFIERFPNPAEWFDHRLAYAHSVATNSMVGYILGLGDRHTSNILIDQSTAELIHIDFGIAFEQGKILPTPETVPFRLTRNIVDGMGVSGVEGVFRRSCEKTMSVLRKNQEKILTILEVLLYDPLYAWTITPKAAAKLQSKESSRASIAPDSQESSSERSKITGVESSSEKNKMAERVLCRLKEKLQGTEDGPVSSIEGQVNRLIQQARDPANLSRLFRGWQAYL